MMRKLITAGIDVGSVCIKAVIYDGSAVIGSAVIPVKGLFQDRAQEALAQALDDAQIGEGALALICATGYAAECLTWANTTQSVASCLTAGAFARFSQKMSLVDLGGEDPKVIGIDEKGKRTGLRSLRKCAAGSGLFLDLVARRLDVHPSRLQTLACDSETPAMIGSYCSVFALSQVYERLRDGETPAAVAAGAIESVAERLYEAGGFSAPVMVSGGMAEYYPNVLQALSRHLNQPVQALPGPIEIAALGAAMKARHMAVRGQIQPETIAHPV